MAGGGGSGYGRGFPFYGPQQHVPHNFFPSVHQQQQSHAMNAYYLQEFHALKEFGNEENKKGNYAGAVECYSEALQFADMIESGITQRDVAIVYSNRSLIFFKLRQIEHALQDAMKCVQIDPTWHKGYWRVSSALKEKKDLIPALNILVTGYGKIKGDNQEATKTKVEFIKEISILSEILKGRPEAEQQFYRCKAPPNVWSKVVLQLAKQKETKVLHRVFLGGGPNLQKGVAGMATNCDASPIKLNLLLRSMAPSDRNRYGMDLMLALIKHGADWKDLSIKTGDTPLHVALNHGMEIANYDFLKYLFSKHAKTREERSLTDSEEATLLHLAAKQHGKQIQTAILFLVKENVDPCGKDKTGKTAADYMDDWALAARLRFEMQQCKHEANRQQQGPSRSGYTKKKQPGLNESGPQSAQGPSGSGDTRKKQPRFNENAPQRGASGCGDAKKKQPRLHESDPQPSGYYQSPSVLQERTRRPYSVASASLKEHVYSKLDIGKKYKIVPGMDKNELKRKIAVLIGVLPKQARIENKKVQKPRELTKHPRHVKHEDKKKTAETDEHEEPERNKLEDEGKFANQPEDVEAEDLQKIDSTVFDNLTWEVECTAKVWKFLRDRRVPGKIKQAVVNKVRLLGEGNWTKSLAKPITHSSDQHIYLYEIKVTSGGRILWQKAIAFSPKRSVIPEERLTENKQEFGGVEGGRIYADVIRVWDVVLDHDNVSHAIDVIVKSVDRGQECILQKKLKGLKNDTIGQATRIPNLYQEILTEDILETKKQDFFPPASSKETEYHIMKFYSFSSSLVNNILQDSSTRVDFPFRVTEKEHAIINIHPKPPCSLLLLGRSGTGKTTCCLYRLWSFFLAYWTHASDDGEPRIPRDFSFRHSKDEELDNETDDSETSSDDDLPEGVVGNPECSEVGETDSEDEEDDMIYDHLHQIFITKNRVLCSEVFKNFRDLAHGCSVASHYFQTEDQQCPHRFQDAPITAFPYFLNSRQFLLMLDASVQGKPFFERNPDGSLKKEMRGWQDGQQTFLDILDMEVESEDDDEDNEEDAEEREVKFDPDAEEKVQKKKGTYDVRHEVTYDVFANKFWKKINKQNLPYHPTLVWMEIRSFIKGSIEALHSEKGKLDLEDYQKLGRKRAPNFTGDRKKIYGLFIKYEQMKKQRFYFDEDDVVLNIYKRLQDVEVPDWVIHQIYVDETQDFTQAELALLIRCCSDPNAIFLTGDTAQSIMRGVAFRFDDLKSLFHYAKNSMKALGKQSAVAVPKKVYQLTHNYRSHTGILELAASVVDLLFYFFPTSFDRLKRDQGLFDGPKPVLLDSCSTSDLALILRGNKRKTSEIEFGAHQVILVANEQAKEHLPEELSLALCLTIFEAKGLEFDDVMIYNFFKDSLAKDEWRVVQEHLQDIQNQELDVESNGSNLFELDIDVMNSAKQPRKLTFDPNKHKVLNSELKYLYTAISRARVNVWIFDEDTGNRKPMFQYFKARKLVRVLEANPDLSSQSQFHDVMFVEKSSAEDWEKRGDYFYSNGLWEVAVKCYQTAGNDEKVLKAKANHRVNEAEKMKGMNMAKMCEFYLEAAYDFLQCGMYNEAARCLFNTKAFTLSAQLFEKIGDVAGAAKIYETRLGSYRDASRCHEKHGDYAMAVRVLKQNREYDKAADVIERYEQRKADNDLPEFFIAPREFEEEELLETAKDETSNHWFVVKMEEKTKIEGGWCGICSKSFDVKPDERERPASSFEGETPTYYGLQREVSVTETTTGTTQMEEHVLTNEHIEKQNYYEVFKQKMTSTLIPLFEETDFLFKRLVNITHEDLDVFHDRVKESRHRFNKTMADVIEKRTWGEFDEVHSWLIIYNKMVKDLSEKSKRMEQPHEIKSDVTGAGMMTNSNDNVAEQIRDELDDEEVQQTLDIPSTKKNSGRGRKKTKKRKGHNLRNK